MHWQRQIDLKEENEQINLLVGEEPLLEPCPQLPASPKSNQPLPDNLDSEKLFEIAKDPNADEENWINACNLLNQRNDGGKSKPKKKHIIFGVKVLVPVILFSIISSACLPIFAPWHAANNSVDPLKDLSYVQMHAHWQGEAFKERVTVRLAVELERRGWSVEKAAKYFGVPSEPMGDLMNGRRKHTFKIDELYKMLYALGEGPHFAGTIAEQELYDSIGHYSRALSLNPQNAHAYWRRAFAYDQLGQMDKAIADLSHSMELRHYPTWQLEKRASMYVKMKKYDLALSDANQLIANFPSENGEEVRAQIWKAMEKYDRALIDDNIAIAKRQMASPDPYHNRAEIYKRLGMYKEAICDLKKVLEIDPNDSDASAEIAQLTNQTKS